MKRFALAAVLAAASCVTPVGAWQDPAPTFGNDDIPTSQPPATPAAPADPPAKKAPDPNGPRGVRNAPVSPPETISWTKSFREARSIAKADQLIVIDVYTDWCGFCKRMDKFVYADPKVAAFAASHVFVKLNAEDGAEGESFARQAGVRGYPTTIVMSGDGRLLANRAGAFARAEDFLGWLQSVR